MTCATSLQAGDNYAPRQQNDEQIATYEIFFKYDLRNGEKDENGKIRNRLYITWLDASGAQLDRYVIDEADEKYKRKIRDNPSTKLKISLVVRKRAPKLAYVHGREMSVERARKGTTGGF